MFKDLRFCFSLLYNLIFSYSDIIYFFTRLRFSNLELGKVTGVARTFITIPRPPLPPFKI